MNKKSTNRLIAILNIVVVVAYSILILSTPYLVQKSLVCNTGKEFESLYGNFIIEFILNNSGGILYVIFMLVGTLNIISAIQNKGNKKICFWQLVFGILLFSSILDEFEFIQGTDKEKILEGIIPIILAIINIIFIRKNKPKMIQVISYIGVIIISILRLFDITVGDIINIIVTRTNTLDIILKLQLVGKIINIVTSWTVISIVMQLVYIHFQDNDIEESKSRRIANFFLYYVVLVILSIGFLTMVLSSLLFSKVNEFKLEREVSNLYNDIENLHDSKINDIYIPVVQNNKYGFINDSGQEKIACQYDAVSDFIELKIDSDLYCFAIAKKDDKFYIISKSNDNVVISGYLEENLQRIYKYEMTVNNDVVDYVHVCNMSYSILTKNGINNREIEKSSNVINLNKNNDGLYSFNNENYSMLIELIYSESEEYPKEKVIITKNNGEQESSIVYFPYLDLYDATMQLFSNGYIGFEDEDNNVNGWFDDNGNKVTISNNYIINDIKDNKVILKEDNTEDYDTMDEVTEHYFVIDMAGNLLLQTTVLYVYDDIYLVENENKKMVIMDKDLHVISNEYDKIIT